jgi:pimeloyl-ACP methyl ester carboxylesterase
MWQSVTTELAPHFRCIAIDFPGFGNSFSSRSRPFSLFEHASLVQELIKRFTSENEKGILIGHDIGGGVAQLCTIKLPDRVKALVLMNSAGLTRDLEKLNLRFHGWFIRKKLKRMFEESSLLSGLDQEALLNPWSTYSSREMLLRAFQALDESWPWHYEKQVWKNAILEINQPVLLLWGKNDSINPPELAAELMQRLPEAYLYLNEHCGHWPSLEHPEWVVLKMKEFLFRAEMNERSKPAQKSLSR